MQVIAHLGLGRYRQLREVLLDPLARFSTFPEWADAQGRFGESRDKDANFRAAFGVTLEEFDRAFAGRWQQVLAQTR